MTRAQLKSIFPQASEQFLATNADDAAEFVKRRAVIGLSIVPVAVTEPEPDVVITESTDEQKLNKLEKAWLAEMKLRGYAFIMAQAVTLKIGSDCRYTPDFTAISPDRKRVAVETKGPFFRDDAKVKLKSAARMFRHLFTFLLVQRDKKTKEWVISEVEP